MLDVANYWLFEILKGVGQLAIMSVRDLHHFLVHPFNHTIKNGRTHYRFVGAYLTKDIKIALHPIPFRQLEQFQKLTDQHKAAELILVLGLLDRSASVVQRSQEFNFVLFFYVLEVDFEELVSIDLR